MITVVLSKKNKKILNEDIHKKLVTNMSDFIVSL